MSACDPKAVGLFVSFFKLRTLLLAGAPVASNAGVRLAGALSCIRCRCRERCDLALMAEPATQQKRGGYRARAQCYLEWARRQIGLAERALLYETKREHLLLAERYMRLADAELAAAVRRDPAF